MTRSIFSLLLMTIVVLSACQQNQPAQEGENTGQMVVPTEQTPEKMLRHVVLFKFKDTSTPEAIDSVITAFKALPGKIPAIKDFEWGTDVSVENRQQGFTHCFFVTFADEAGRDAYLPHPDHQAFGKLVGPHLDQVLVVDYFVEK